MRRILRSSPIEGGSDDSDLVADVEIISAYTMAQMRHLFSDRVKQGI